MDKFADINADFEYLQKMIVKHEEGYCPFSLTPFEHLLFQSCSIPLTDMLENLLEHLDNIALYEEDDVGEMYATTCNDDYRSKLLYDCLAVAVEENHDDVIRLLLEFAIQKTTVITSSDGRYTLLHCAAANGDVGIIERLIKSGIDVNQTNREEETALHFAPDAATVEVLLANGADVSALGRSGKTPLYYALARYRFDVMKKLMEKGATTNEDLLTLNEACGSGDNSRIASSLLSFGTDELLIPDGCMFYALSGHTTSIVNGDELEMCKLCKSENQPMVAELMAQKATVTNKRTYPQLHDAISKDSDLSEIRTFLTIANVNIIDKSGTTALYVAVERNLLEVATLLLDFGADPNLTTSARYPLIVACRYLSYEFVRLLLNRGADPNVSDQGKSPLGIAAASFDQPLVELLVEHGADVHHRDRRGRTAVYSLVENLRDNIHKCPLSAACCIEIVKYLLDKGSDVNQTDKHGHSMLYNAISIQLDRYETGRFFRSSVLHKLIDLLLERGADAKGEYVWSASIGNQSYSVVRKLLEDGADPNQTLRIQSTPNPLSAACGISDVHCARILLAAGANPDFIDWRYCALARFNIELINLLLNSGMKLSVLSKNKQIPELTEFFVTECENAKWSSELFKAGSDLNFLEIVCKKQEKTITPDACGDLGGRLCQAIVLASHNVQQQQLIQQLRESGRLQDDDLASWLEENSMTPLSVSCLSRIVIRRQLSAASGCRTILPLIDVLPIPKQLQLYLRFEGPCSEVVLTADDGNQKSDSCSCE